MKREVQKAEFIHEVIHSLYESPYDWCIPSGYRQLPEVNSDIDIIVSVKPIKVMKYLVSHFKTLNITWRLVQFREGTNCFCIFAGLVDGKLDYVYLDLTQHFYFDGIKLIDGKLFLSRVQWYHDIPIPPHTIEFIYIFLKKILAQQLTQHHFNQLKILFDKDPDGCNALLCSYYKLKESQLINEAIKFKHYHVLQHNIKHFKNQLLHRNPINMVFKKYFLLAYKLYKRVRAKPGIEVICLGPDGSGKSTSIIWLEPEIKPLLNIQKYHLRAFPPKIYGLNNIKGNPHKNPPYSLGFSFIKLCSYSIFSWIGRLFVTNKKKLRATLVLFDRSYHDIIVDPKRFRLNIPPCILIFVSNLFPKPDFFLIFDAPTEVIQARKKEVPFEETDQQRRRYLLFKKQQRNAHLINTNVPPQEVITQINDIILSYMANRVIHRLRLKDE